MKNKIFIILFLFSCSSINAQQQNINDSFLNIINQQKGDTAEVNALAYLGNQQSDFHLAIKYVQQGLLLAKKLNYKKGEADCLLVYAGVEDDFSHAIQYALDALNIYEELKDKTGIATAHLIMEDNYWIAGDYKNALFHAFAGEQAAETNNITGSIVFSGHHLTPLFLAEIGQTYLLENKLDSAKVFTQKSLDQNELFNGVKWGFPVYLMAYIQTIQGNYKIALENFRSAISLSVQNGFSRDTLQILSGISTLFQKTNEPDSSIYYAQIVVQHWNNESEIKNLIEALNNLTLAYKLKGKKDSVIKYIELHQTLKDSIFSRDKDRELQNITFNEKLNQQEILSAHVKYKNKVQIYVLASGLFVVLLIAGIFWRNNYHRQKAYTLLEKQKQEIDLQKQKVETTLSELKSAQSQLIQSEKMASLGELAAGIAHEIQNPLNFVNNFSEVNRELINELKEELQSDNKENAIAIVNNLDENEEKIIHHGKRADAIVKGLLQHSQSGTGQKDLVNINAIADECLRLSYHGFRAKDKSFQASLQTDFDDTIDKIPFIQQDIVRVLVNLFNNAFYAVNEKSKQQIQGYEPIVSVSTKKINNNITITVRDNGNGIPQKVIDKIFQPFFTTKPTGQGTGLGLSLSYDIIKAHGGEIKVETKEGEGVEFIIKLPGS